MFNAASWTEQGGLDASATLPHAGHLSFAARRQSSTRWSSETQKQALRGNYSQAARSFHSYFRNQLHPNGEKIQLAPSPPKHRCCFSGTYGSTIQRAMTMRLFIALKMALPSAPRPWLCSLEAQHRVVPALLFHLLRCPTPASEGGLMRVEVRFRLRNPCHLDSYYCPFRMEASFWLDISSCSLRRVLKIERFVLWKMILTLICAAETSSKATAVWLQL